MPDIIVNGKDPRFTSLKFAQFRNGGDITLKTAIPGHRQSLGDTESRHRYFKATALKIIDKIKKKKTEPVDWQEYAATSMMRLDFQDGGTMFLHRATSFRANARIPDRYGR